MIQTKKFISPGGWFSIEYPATWNEFEDSAESFLFYNPNVWGGNFRISAYKDVRSIDYGARAVSEELKNNKGALLKKIGTLNCAYSREDFEENGVDYTMHWWITGLGNVSCECSFTAPRGSGVEEAERIVASLQVREEGKKYPSELIPVRLSEIAEVNEAYEWVSTTVKSLLKKDFQGVEGDLEKLQSIMEQGHFTPKQKEVWMAFGITLCVILTNEFEGMEWRTLFDGNREAPVLYYTVNGQTIDPMSLVWSKVKRGETCHLVETYQKIIETLG